MTAPPPRPPTFFWHGVLIVLPVVALSAAGFFSLRQDRILARHEAASQARELADEAARLVWASLTAAGSRDAGDAREQPHPHSFRVGARGNLIFPPPVSPLPFPQPLEISRLTPSQRRLWLAAQEDAGPAALEACRQFVESDPSAPFAALARFRLGMLLRHAGNVPEATEAFRWIVEQAPDAVAESGARLRPLAEINVLQLLAADAPAAAQDNAGLLSVRHAVLDGFCSNQVDRPTFLTPELLRRVAVLEPALGLSNVASRWQAEWDQHTTRRALALAATHNRLPHESTPARPIAGAAEGADPPPAFPAVFWFHHPDPAAAQTLPGAGGAASAPALGQTPHDVAWLAARTSDGDGGFWIVPRPMALFTSSLTNAAQHLAAWTELRLLVPQPSAWLECRLEVAGIVVRPGRDEAEGDFAAAGRNGAVGEEPDLLAVATHVEDGAEVFRVTVNLANAGLFFARQNARTRLFGALIALAAAVGLVGFLSAWRAFRRQQELSELKSNFVSSVSHELRAPIASVRLLAETLERGKIPDPARQAEYFTLIVQECRRLSSLIENVLDCARMEGGRRPYELEPTDVGALVRQTVRLMEPAAQEKGVRLETVGAESDPTSAAPLAMLDGQAIARALVNLIDNAIKHSPSGSTVSVRLEQFLSDPASAGGVTARHRPGPGKIRFTVEDRGPGIPACDHERIFDRFFRRGSELRRESTGVGIGLSIVKHMVEAHGGRVFVQSAPGDGSRFILELPLPALEEQT